MTRKRVDPPKPEPKPITPDESHKITAAVLEQILGSDAVVFVPTAAAPKPSVGWPPEPKQPTEIDDGMGGIYRPGVILTTPERSPFDKMRDSLKAGVKVVTAPQLFPTPDEVAGDMVRLADIEPGFRILEPNAGTGKLIEAVFRARAEGSVEITAVEINQALAAALRDRWSGVQSICADFLAFRSDPIFDLVLMNPPFENAVDIKHVRHALTLLRPGGRLVGICADGSRQNAQLRGIASSWEPLPSGTFAGTSVRSVLFTINKED